MTSASSSPSWLARFKRRHDDFGLVFPLFFPYTVFAGISLRPDRDVLVTGVKGVRRSHGHVPGDSSAPRTAAPLSSAAGCPVHAPAAHLLSSCIFSRFFPFLLFLLGTSTGQSDHPAPTAGQRAPRARRYVTLNFVLAIPCHFARTRRYRCKKSRTKPSSKVLEKNQKPSGAYHVRANTPRGKGSPAILL